MNLLKVLALLVYCGPFSGPLFVSGQGLTWSRIVPQNELSTNGTLSSCLGYDSYSDMLVLFGGAEREKDGSVSYPNETWIYSRINGTWIMVHNGASSASPPGRALAYFGMLRVNETSLFVITHGTNGDTFMSDFGDTWVFNLVNYEWTEITPKGNGPGPRNAGFFGAAYGSTDTLWFGGGFVSEELGRRIETFKLVFTGNTEARWEKVYGQTSQYDPLKPHSRCATSSTVVNRDRLIVIGGCTSFALFYGGPCPSDDAWVFDGEEEKWTPLPRCVPRLGGGMAPVVGSPGKAILHGGTFRFGPLMTTINPSIPPDDELFIVDVEEKTMTRHKALAINNTFPATRAGHVILAIGNNTLLMFGGFLTGRRENAKDLWMLSGDPDQTETIECDNVWFSYYHLHGLLNAIAFGILFPLGFLFPRYYRCKSSKGWFLAHVIVQVTGVIFSIVGFIVIFVGLTLFIPTVHGLIGLFLELLVLVQIVNGIFRPRIKQDEDKTKYRKCWEWFHRIWGFSVIIIGFIQVTLGVFLIIPPLAVWVVWIIMFSCWIITFIIHEVVKWICYCKSSDGHTFEHHEMK